MRDDDGSPGGQAGEVVLEPCNIDSIQVVSRLIEEDISTERHSMGQCKLHFPTTIERADHLCLFLVREADQGESVDFPVPFLPQRP